MKPLQAEMSTGHQENLPYRQPEVKGLAGDIKSKTEHSLETVNQEAQGRALHTQKAVGEKNQDRG